MEIRPATINDWTGIEKINAVIDYGNPKEFMLEHIQLNRVLLAEIQEEVIGYALWQIIWGNTPFLSLVKVLPSYQQKGAGSALISAFENHLKAQGFRTYISSTMSDNQLGKQFHLKKGFSDIGTLKMHYGNEIFYEKKI